MDLNQHSGFLLTYKQWIEIGVIVVTTIIITRVLKLVMRRYINRSADYLKMDKTRYRFFSNMLLGTIYIFAAIFIIHTIPALRSISTTLFASAGILAAVIGFASQQAVSNIIGGIFVVIFRPFRVGDNIKVGNDLSGVVEDITLRHTVIRDAENARIIIPNSLINSQTVINFDIIDAKFKKRILYNISLESDAEKAIRIIKQKLYEQPEIIKTMYPTPDDIEVEMVAITDKFVSLRAYVWTINADKAGRLGNNMNRIIFETFKKQDIHFSEPQTLVIQRDEKPAQ